mgnify:FL=1
MKQIIINFQTHGPIHIQLEESRTAELFAGLLQKNLSREKPIWRDPMKYTLGYFKTLCMEVKEKLGWDWNMEGFSMESTVHFHKDIEDFLEKEQSFRKIPGELQNLLHEAHYCIHIIQYMNNKNPRGAFLQFEWFNDDYIDLPLDKEFSRQVDVGDIILQNPYVGHPPIQCFCDDDYKNISRTCAYHDRILPGLKIVTYTSNIRFSIEKYKKWWNDNCKEFVAKEGMDQILKYTGFPVIGKVNNIEHLKTIINEKSLALEGITIT